MVSKGYRIYHQLGFVPLCAMHGYERMRTSIWNTSDSDTNQPPAQVRGTIMSRNRFPPAAEGATLKMGIYSKCHIGLGFRVLYAILLTV